MVWIMWFRVGLVGYSVLLVGIALAVHGAVTGWPPSEHLVPKSLQIGAPLVIASNVLIQWTHRRKRRADDREWFEQHRARPGHDDRPSARP
jgi:hypothetical protein